MNKYYSSPSESDGEAVEEPPAQQPQPVRFPIADYKAKDVEYLKKTNPYQQPVSKLPQRRIAQLLGPNKQTLCQKQRNGADPVANIMKYEKIWQI